VCGSVKNRLIDSLKKRQFDVALPLLSAMKETWPSDNVFTAPALTDNTSDDSSLSTDEDSTSCLVDNFLGYLQHIFLGEQYNTIIQFVTRSRSIIKSEAWAVGGLAEVWALVN